MEKLNEAPELVSMTLHFSDGSHKAVNKGLFARTMPAGGVEAMCLGITATDYLTILAAMEGTADRVVAEAK